MTSFVPLRLAALLVGAALGLAAVPAQAQTAPHPHQRAETHVESHRAAQRSGESRFDVIVVGATPAGIAAAVSAAREGQRVALTDRTHRIGGLTASGLSNTDFISFESLGGLWKEFMDRVVAHYEEQYGKNARQVQEAARGAYYEPKVALTVFRNMIAEEGERIDVFRQHLLTGASVDSSGAAPRLETARFEKIEGRDEYVEIDGEFERRGRFRTLRGDVFIDATYEGDLMAAGGVPYAMGVEARSVYGESLAPTQGNDHVQCANFRVTLTHDSTNRLPIPTPPNYDRSRYALLIDSVQAGTIETISDITHGPLRPAPNEKADFNDMHGAPVSTRICNSVDDWPEASPERRADIFLEAKNHAMGLFYFLQHDEAFREAAPGIAETFDSWGLPADEFEQSGHWPSRLYIREGRRMEGRYVFTQQDAQHAEGSARAPAHPQTVAMGDYPFSVHGTYTPEPGRTTGVFGASTRPFQVPYGVMLPQQLNGLLVPVAVSSSHLGFQPIRLEPTWTALGQAAGLAAAQALQTGEEVRDVDVTRLQHRLHERGAKTFYASDVPPSSPYFAAVQYFGNRGYFQKGRSAQVWPWDQWGGEAEEVPGVPVPHQWRTALPRHDIAPEEPVTEKRARAWLEKAGVDADAFGSYEGMTRGAFLNRLYERIGPVAEAASGGADTGR